MSPPRRFTDDELHELLGLAGDDPRLEPVRADAAAWARFLALREFLSPSAPPEGARPEEASRRLRAALAGALGEPAPEAAPRAERASASAPRARATPGPWRWGWLAAAAAVAIVTVVLLPRREPGSQLRGDGSTLALLGAHAEADGVRLAWRSAPGADRYEVVLLAPDLSPLGSPRETADTTLVVLREGALAALPRSGTVLWRVTALRLGTPVAASATDSFALP